MIKGNEFLVHHSPGINDPAPRSSPGNLDRKGPTVSLFEESSGCLEDWSISKTSHIVVLW